MGAWIDLKRWKRRDHFQLFRRYKQPFFSVTVDVDVTSAWSRCRKRGAPSFFLTSVFAMLNAVNDVEAFRLRLRPRGVWRHDAVAVGPTTRSGSPGSNRPEVWRCSSSAALWRLPKPPSRAR